MVSPVQLPDEPFVPKPADRPGPTAAELADVRLEGARFVARALRDLLGNQLAVAVGYLELLERDPRLDPALRDWAGQARQAAAEAAGTVHRAAELRRLVEAPRTPGEEARLDLDRSTRAG